MRGDGERAPWGGEAGGYRGFLEGDAVEDGAATEVGLERAESGKGEQWATGDGVEILCGEGHTSTSMNAVDEADNPC
jgi:hypothetical protein